MAKRIRPERDNDTSIETQVNEMITRLNADYFKYLPGEVTTQNIVKNNLFVYAKLMRVDTRFRSQFDDAPFFYEELFKHVYPDLFLCLHSLPCDPTGVDPFTGLYNAIRGLAKDILYAYELDGPVLAPDSYMDSLVYCAWTLGMVFTSSNWYADGYMVDELRPEIKWIEVIETPSQTSRAYIKRPDLTKYDDTTFYSPTSPRYSDDDVGDKIVPDRTLRPPTKADLMFGQNSIIRQCYKGDTEMRRRMLILSRMSGGSFELPHASYYTVGFKRLRDIYMTMVYDAIQHEDEKFVRSLVSLVTMKEALAAYMDIDYPDIQPEYCEFIREDVHRSKKSLFEFIRSVPGRTVGKNSFDEEFIDWFRPLFNAIDKFGERYLTNATDLIDFIDTHVKEKDGDTATMFDPAPYRQMLADLIRDQRDTKNEALQASLDELVYNTITPADLIGSLTLKIGIPYAVHAAMVNTRPLYNNLQAILRAESPTPLVKPSPLFEQRVRELIELLPGHANVEGIDGHEVWANFAVYIEPTENGRTLTKDEVQKKQWLAVQKNVFRSLFTGETNRRREWFTTESDPRDIAPDDDLVITWYKKARDFYYLQGPNPLLTATEICHRCASLANFVEDTQNGRLFCSSPCRDTLEMSIRSYYG